MKQNILTLLKGMAMGAADVVPGVSGGTIAFITGIYERLLNAIKNVNLHNLKLFFTGKFKEFWRNIDGTFLLMLILGIGISFLSIAKLMTYLLEHQPVLVWAFFFGLVLASAIFVGKTVKWNVKTILFLVVFAVLSFFITSPSNLPLATSDSYLYIFVCGAIAICAMILPGISGSFILLLLGEYAYMLNAISTLNLTVILIFIIGAAIGIISFSHALSWLFKRFKQATLAALTGFMLGSLNKIWPWKNASSTFIQDGNNVRKVLIENNVLPGNFEGDNQLILAIAIFLAGLILIFAVELISKKLHKDVTTGK